MPSRYHGVYADWQSDNIEFWARAAQDVEWFTGWDTPFDPDAGIYGRWFPGATCNTCHNCVDRHARGQRPGQTALIYDSPMTGKVTKFSYSQLLDEVQAVAKVLIDLGVEKGDRVIIYMPMIPEAVFSMLACARIGAVHSVVFGGFAAQELATRIDDCSPKAILAASCGLEPNRVVAYKPLIDAAISLAKHKPSTCLILQRPELGVDLEVGRDHDWTDLVGRARDAGYEVPCEPVGATDPLYILYTSGTTGQPKGVVRDNGGHMVALKWTMSNVYGVEPGEVYWAASDVGWVVGHSYIVYAPLLHGCTTVLFEGKPVGTPDAGAFWRMIEEHRVAVLFTAPTAFRAIKKEDPDGTFVDRADLTSLRALFLAGERADSDTVRWAEAKLQVPVIDHWWQTETGWSIAANALGLGMLPVKHGSPAVPMPGYDVCILSPAGEELPADEMGSIAVKLPLPPGCLPTLWGNDQRFKDSYLTEFPGSYATADAGYRDKDGYLYVMARTDDIINVAGHRLSTGAIEEVLTSHPDVAEAAVMGVADTLKGQLPAGFVVLKAGVNRPVADIEAEVVQLVRETVGPVAAFKLAITVKRLPKTRSGKILRGTMRAIADGRSYKVPATIDDPVILDEIAAALAARGYGTGKPGRPSEKSGAGS